MNKIKIVTIITLFLISLTGCKKSQEEIEKEKELQNKKLALDAINSVYQLGSSGFAFLVDSENAKRMRNACLEDQKINTSSKLCWEYMNYWGDTCFDFKPKEGKATVKFYKYPTIYNFKVKAKDEFEYILTYEGREVTLKLELTTNASNLLAKANLIVPGDKSASGDVGNMDLVYGFESSTHHGRFNSIEECDAQNAADEELSKSLREQKSTCEGPGC
ncbi:lipoprotein, tandem type [Leptospira noguchii]|uniref:lipoprotein, tandem type n=1 Tax=Leptospira noguchii TaxID=28182 RepID=UPI0007745A04|nr:lipoprotein, tandem type [Leptospira noguchii]TQE68246.1 lipoprotein, tandem type [Leptospira noguchii]UOG30191.1 lipoprotein, tandem type [Leptospira noguchii]UOG48431.1 lipoprotein, tandem type [Leptospira noguchii]UOG52271.1 lipoprotein, tandem type [Leptospira noguchii]